MPGSDQPKKKSLNSFEVEYNFANSLEFNELVEPDPPVDALAHRRGLGPVPKSKIENDTVYETSLGPLTAEQLVAANLILDFNDHRSQAAKLRSLGIPTTKYNNWLKIPAFQEYVRSRSENLLSGSVHESHVSLLKNVQRGNQRSIEYYNEITGRYNPRTQDLLNLGSLLIQLVEIIQKHVKDPEVIRIIAAEFNEIVPAMTTLQQPPVDELKEGGFRNALGS